MNSAEAYANRNRQKLQEALAQLKKSDETIVEMKKLDQDITNELPKIAKKAERQKEIESELNEVLKKQSDLIDASMK